MNICVCICTYQRPARLKALLLRLGEQDTAGEFTLSVVVADNDRAQSARVAVSEAAALLPFAVTYRVEPEQNIAKARNAAVLASDGEYLAFIDDDETPPNDWLRQALHACRTYEVDGVLAPVRPRFEQPPPAWLVKGRFCERPEPPTGHLLSWRETRTGNVLLRRSLIDGMAEPFSPAFGSGGEDLDFFRRLMDRGARFVWCNEAAVDEFVPPERCSRGYFLRRALLRGQNEKGLTNLASVGKSLVAVPLYALLLPFAALAGPHWAMDLSIRWCEHAGKLASVLGFKPMGAKYMTQSPQNGAPG